MNIQPVGNRDRCGNCDPSDYVAIGTQNKTYPSLAPRFELKLRAKVDLSGAKLDPPYNRQNDGQGGYKLGHIERFIING